jgi:hypothetical protein
MFAEHYERTGVEVDDGVEVVDDELAAQRSGASVA